MRKLICMVLSLALMLTAFAAFAEGNATPADFSGMTLDARILSCNEEAKTVNATIRAFELHEANEIENLRIDDKMTIGGVACIVKAIDEDGTIHVVEESAPDAGETQYTPCKTDDGKYYLDEFEKPVMVDVATLNFELSEDFKFIDNIDPETGDMLDDPVERTQEDFFAAIKAEGVAFDSDNTTLTFDDNGKIVEVIRDYAPWQ